MLPVGVTLGPLDESERRAVQVLYQKSFPYTGQQLDSFEERIGPDTTAVARRGGEVLGFVTWSTVGSSQLPLMHTLRMLCTWARFRNRPERIEERIAQSEYGKRFGSPRVVFFGHDVPEPDGADAYISELAVLPEHQGTGLGRALLEHALEVCRERLGATRAWATCWMNGPSAALFERLGFEGVIEIGPYYSDASSGRLVSRALRSAPPTPTTSPTFHTSTSTPCSPWIAAAGGLTLVLIAPWIAPTFSAVSASVPAPMVLGSGLLTLAIESLRVRFATRARCRIRASPTGLEAETALPDAPPWRARYDQLRRIRITTATSPFGSPRDARGTLLVDTATGRARLGPLPAHALSALVEWIDLGTAGRVRFDDAARRRQSLDAAIWTYARVLLWCAALTALVWTPAGQAIAIALGIASLAPRIELLRVLRGGRAWSPWGTWAAVAAAASLYAAATITAMLAIAW